MMAESFSIAATMPLTTVPSAKSLPPMALVEQGCEVVAAREFMLISSAMRFLGIALRALR